MHARFILPHLHKNVRLSARIFPPPLLPSPPLTATATTAHLCTISNPKVADLLREPPLHVAYAEGYTSDTAALPPIATSGDSPLQVAVVVPEAPTSYEALGAVSPDSPPSGLPSSRESLDASPVDRTLWASMWESTRQHFMGIIAGDRVALAKSITLIESTREDHRKQAESLLDALLLHRARQWGVLERHRKHVHISEADNTGPSVPLAYGGRMADMSDASVNFSQSTSIKGSAHSQTPAVTHRSTFRVGIAGPPGAGKSTLIEALGMLLVQKGHRVAVIAVDPSSSRSGGSILGDKTRMTELSRHSQAFVRPSPTRGALGGVAQHTNDVVLLCEGAGYDIVIVESVGLGQSEVVIDATVDCLLLVVPPAGGDELQGVKKGIVEVADLVVVNKADGDLERPAKHAAAEYRRALQLIRWKHPMWQPRVLRCSALANTSIDELWEVACEFRSTMESSGQMQVRRSAQSCEWMWHQLDAQLLALAKADEHVGRQAQRLNGYLSNGFVTPRRAAHELVRTFLSTVVASGATAGQAAPSSS